MKSFEVTLFANDYFCDAPGYYQWVEARDTEGKWCGSIIKPHESGGEDFVIRIMTKTIIAKTAYSAMCEFLDWQSSGCE